MSPSVREIVEAVLERIQAMPSQPQRKAFHRYPVNRRPPREYIKKLKDTSRVIPDVALPTGPMPDEPWCEPDYDDEPYIPLVGEAWLEYDKEHSHRSRMTQYQAERAIASFLTHARLHDHDPIFLITRESCKSWRVSLMNAKASPRARNKRAPGPVTIEKRMKQVDHFLRWCVKREYLPSNPMSGLELPQRLVSAAKTRKTSFSDEELYKIIPALLALPTEDLPRTEFKWAALALMFSGARCMEILQLRHKDVRQVEGVWVFDITPEEGNQLKNHPSMRLVPIHSQLIQLGFLEWFAKRPQPQGNRSKVFPLIYPKGSPLVSMWFSRLLKELQIKKPAVSLHSLRHTLTVKLAQARTYPPLQNRLLGHAIGKSVEDRVYLAGLQFSVKELKDALEVVRFPST